MRKTTTIIAAIILAISGESSAANPAAADSDSLDALLSGALSTERACEALGKAKETGERWPNASKPEKIVCRLVADGESHPMNADEAAWIYRRTLSMTCKGKNPWLLGLVNAVLPGCDGNSRTLVVSSNADECRLNVTETGKFAAIPAKEAAAKLSLVESPAWRIVAAARPSAAALLAKAGRCAEGNAP